jgi:hypothetical protein
MENHGIKLALYKWNQYECIGYVLGYPLVICYIAVEHGWNMAYL